MKFRTALTAAVTAASLLTVVSTASIAEARAKGVPASQVCPGTKYHPGDAYGPFEWGTVTVELTGITYDVSAGYEVRLCVKGGPTNNTATFTGPATGELLTPTLKNGKHAGLSHWSVVSVTTVGP